MLIRKMLRDMKQNKAQFISIFIMTILGVFIYSGISSEWNGLNKIITDYYSDTKLADAWVYSTDFSEEATGKVLKIDGITGAERRLTLNSVAELKDSPTVKLHFIEKYKISTFRLLEGEEFSLNKDGIWLDSPFAKKRGLMVGDKLKFTFNGYTLEKEIKGLIISPEYVYSAAEGEIIPTHYNYGYGFLPYQSFPKELPIVYNELMVTASASSDINIEEEIDKALDSKYSVFLLRENLRSYMQFNEELKEHRAMGKIFPVAFLAVALLTTITTMARLVNNQRTQIGILKAVGFKQRRILYHYISYGLWLSLTGTVIGVVAGSMTLPYLFYGPMQTTFTLPHWYSKMPLSVLVMAIISVVGATFITYLTCRKVLKDTPSGMLRPKAPKAVKHSFLDRLRIWKHLGFQAQWNIRDIIRCKGRSIMAIVGIIGCSSLLICGFSMQDSLNYVVDWNFKVQNLYESRVELDKEITNDLVKAIINTYGGEELLEGSVEIKANGSKRSGEFTVTDHNKLLRFVDDKGANITLPEDQTAISYKIAKLLGIEIGDEINWHIYGEEGWKTATIGAIYRTPIAQGITMPRAVYEDYGYSFLPTAILSDKDLTKVIPGNTEGIIKVQTKKYMIESYNTMSEAMDIMVYVLIAAASLLAIVVIYNLGILSFTERQRELSTLKVIGFKTKKLRTLLLTQNIWLTVIGIIPGIPIGLWIVRYIFQFVGKVFDFIIIANVSSYLYTILGTMLISILVNRFFSKRLKKIDMVSSLKGVE